MRFSISKSARSKSSQQTSTTSSQVPAQQQQYPGQQPPPSPPGPQPPQPPSEARNSTASTIGRSASFRKRPDLDSAQQSPPPPSLAGGLSRSQTVRPARKDGDSTAYPASNRSSTVLDYTPEIAADTPPSAQTAWSPNFHQLPTPQERQQQAEAKFAARQRESVSMSHAGAKTSQDSGSQAVLDRFTQRRLQRLNTEQGFREQRQAGGQAALSPPLSNNAVSSLNTSSSGNGGEHAGYSSTSAAAAAAQHINSNTADAQPQPLHHSSQPHANTQHVGYQSRTGQQPTIGLGLQTPQPSSSTTSSTSRAQHYPPPPQPQQQQQQQQQDSQPHVHQYSADAASSHDVARPNLNQSRSFSQQNPSDDSSSMSNNGAAIPAPKATRAGNGNRQSVHNGLNSREGSHSTQGGQPPAFNASVVPPGSQGQPYNANTKSNASQQPPPSQQNEAGRGTPQPLQIAGDEMTPEEVEQLQKEHKELREKYTKVKKYYFEKEDQVKQLQNSLAHQRLSQSRTSLDDSEYTTRFNRLDGLIAQLAFSIRKSWKTIPQWLANSVNRDAVATGKQEMTAAGRSFISFWLVEEVFDKYFHPDLETTLSSQLKTVQRNIRKSAPISQTAEEEEYLTSKVVNWRLATLEGLQDQLRAPSCPENRQKLTDHLKDSLVGSLALHLQDPPPSDLEGGVHMIIELVVSIAIHLPLESRDVVIEYFQPGYSIMSEQMKIESGIPQLTASVADDAAERASMKSATSDLTDMTNDSSEQPSKKRSMLSALTGNSAKPKAQGKHAAAGGSSSSLNRPESSHGMKEDTPPRVRMAAGIGVSVRGRSVLVKAPVFST